MRTTQIRWQLACLLVFSSIYPVLAAGPARQDLLLRDGWKFMQQDIAGAETPAFDDSTWKAISVPHCWNIEPGENGDSEHFDKGPGWYRLHIKPDAALAGKSFFLKFDAAYHSAEVFVNGKPAGKHIGGFGAFCFDVTPLLRAGEDNVLAVKVYFTALCDSPPLGGDFTKFPGLYRNVHLLALDPLSVTPVDDAGPGVYLKQAHVDDASAEVQITAKLRNANAAAKNATVRCRLLDAAGQEVQAIAAEQSVPASGVADCVQTMKIEKPHLWNGRLDPYMYQVAVEVSDGAAIVDRVVQPLGLRYFRVDPAAGFFLNGKKYELHGVNRHQQRPGKGWAISREDIAEDVNIMCEMGCTTVRTCHYQHADDYHALCDQAGLVVWAELAMVNGVRYDSPDFVNNTHQQFAELIKQNFNHPSICFWSLWNEIKIPKGGTEKEKLAQCMDFIRSLNAQAKQLDPTRLTTGASCCGTFEPMTIIDAPGWNGYPGWYSGKPDGWPTVLEEVTAKINGHALSVSEYGAGASVLYHQMENVQPKPGGHFHPEEWQSLVHEEHWKALRKSKLWGTFIWVMFDFASIGRREGDHPGVNDKGLVTADRKTRKDAFYFYQAQWTTSPMVHINSRRFNPHPAGKTAVKVYTNCQSVELLLNGRSLGQQKADNCVCVWADVDLPAGQNKLEARSGAAVDTIEWNCAADAPAHMGPIDPPTKPKSKSKAK